MSPACEEVLGHLGSPLPQALADHVRGCAHCRGVLQAHQALARVTGIGVAVGDVPPPPALVAVAALPPPKVWWLSIAGLSLVELAAAGAGVLALGRHGMVNNRAAPAVLVGTALGIASFMFACTFAALGRGGRLGRLAFGSGVALLALVVGLAGSGLGDGRPFAAGTGCLVAEVGVAAVPWALALWLLSRTAFEPTRAWLAGAGASAAGLFTLHLHCSNGTTEHLVAFHVVPWLALGALASLVRSKLRSRTFAR